MRILMMSPFYPWPVNAGERIRIDHILRGLANWSEITFIAPVQGEAVIPDDLPAAITVIPVPHSLTRVRKLWSLLSPKPYHVRLFESRAIDDAVREQINTEQFDFAYFHFFYALQYLPQDSKLPRILDQHNVDTLVWSRRVQFGPLHRRMIYLLNLWKTKSYEMSQLESLWAYVSVSEEDGKLTEAYAAPTVKHFFVAPNCINPQAFTPIDWGKRPAKKEIVLAFMGSYGMDFNSMAAERLCRDIYPKIKAQHPDTPFRLLIIGKNPPRRLIAMGEADDTITITGYVDDVRPWLNRADIFVAPLTFGAGTKLKIIEAMSTALPIVGSDIALQGLGGENGTHYLRANSDEAIVQAVGELMADPAKRFAIGDNGRTLAEKNFDFRIVTQNLFREIEAALPVAAST